MKLTCQREISSEIVKCAHFDVIALERKQMRKMLVEQAIEEMAYGKHYKIAMNIEESSRINGREIFDGGKVAFEPDAYMRGTVSLVLRTRLLLEEDVK